MPLLMPRPTTHNTHHMQNCIELLKCAMKVSTLSASQKKEVIYKCTSTGIINSNCGKKQS